MTRSTPWSPRSLRARSLSDALADRSPTNTRSHDEKAGFTFRREISQHFCVQSRIDQAPAVSTRASSDAGLIVGSGLQPVIGGTNTHSSGPTEPGESASRTNHAALGSFT